MPAKGPPLHQPGDLINGRYRIERVLGRGAMGEVYLAHDQAGGDQLVAMKYLLSTNQQSAVNRFKAEFATLVHLSHPHITPVYDLARDNTCGVHFFTTEYVVGTTFDVAAQELPVDTVVGLWVQALRALQYLHGHGRLHLDIKAHNVMIHAAAGAQPCAKLIDFGLAATGWCGKRLGTPSYMAPEIVQEQEPDRRADLYSMGVLLYLVLTRMNPFRAKTPLGTMQRQVTLVPPPPSFYQPSLRAAHGYLDTIVKHLLAKDPADRYDSAEAVIGELGRMGPVAYDVETDETLGAYVPNASVFVGREAERAVLRAQVMPYEEGVPIAWITGARGVGKTRLLQEAKAMAQVADYYTLWVSFDAPGGFAAAVARIQRLAGVRSAPDEHSMGIDDGSRDHLTRTPDGAVEPSLENDTSRTWIGLDDADRLLQDERAAALWPPLRSLCAQIALRYQLGEAQPVTLVMSSAADAGTSTAMRQALGLTDVGTTALPLHHFSDAELPAYLAVVTGLSDPPASLVTQIADYTGGHPLFVTETVKALIHRGLLFDHAGRWRSSTFEDIGVNLRQLHIPGTIESVVAQAYAGCSPAEQVLLGVVAVADRAISSTWLGHVLGRAVTVDDITAASLQALLHYDPVTAGVRYPTRAHQQAIYQQIGQTQRQQWHDAVANLLAADPAGDLAELCWHRSHGSDPARAQEARRLLATHWMECGRAAEAIPVMTQYLQAATPDDAQVWGVRELLGKAYQRARRFDQAITVFREAIAALGLTGSTATMPAVLQRGWYRRYREAWGHAAMRQRQCAEAEQQYRQVLAMVAADPAEQAEAIRLRNAIIQAQLYQAKHPDAIAAAVTQFRETAAAAKALPPDLARTIINNDLGHALMQQRAFDEATDVLSHDTAAFAAAEQIAAQIRALGLLSEAHRAVRRYDDAEIACREAITLAKAQHDTEQLMHGYNNLGNIAGCRAHEGNDPVLFDRAIGHYERALDLSMRLDDVGRTLTFTVNLGILHRQRGNLHRAARLLTSAIALVEGRGRVDGLDEQAWCQAHLELGNLYAQQKDFPQAHQQIERARQLAETNPSCRALWFWAVATEVEIARDEGQMDRAKQQVPEMQRLATTPETKALAQQIIVSLGLRG